MRRVSACHNAERLSRTSTIETLQGTGPLRSLGVQGTKRDQDETGKAIVEIGDKIDQLI
jgi:hypothetical protein